MPRLGKATALGAPEREAAGFGTALKNFRTDRFLTVQNFTNIIRQAASVGLISIGMMLAILTGGIDLSVGSLMALSTILMGKAVQAGAGGLWPVLVCLGAGFGLGALNGVLLTKLKLPHRSPECPSP
jgi:ribose transport system permease protein